MKNVKNRVVLIIFFVLLFVVFLLYKQATSKETPSSSCSQLKKISKSILMQNAVRLQLFRIIKEFEINSLAHVFCGQADWMNELSFNLQKYIGIDNAKEIIESNREIYSSQNCSFQTLDVSRDLLPTVDLIFCEETLQNLSKADIQASLVLFKKSGAKFLLTTSYGKIKRNIKGKRAKFAPLNFEISPYNFLKPLLSIDLNDTEGKKLCLWKLDEIP